jgi:chemotaxis protein CheD
MTKEFVVEAATYRVANNPTVLTCLGLGSCLGIALHEYRARIGGLGHPLLPRVREGIRRNRPERYVDGSIQLMMDDILERGGLKRNVSAKLVGGARMFSNMSSEALDIGRRNIEVARDILRAERIRIKAEDVGGSHGRTIHFDVRTGKITIRTMGQTVKEI